MNKPVAIDTSRFWEVLKPSLYAAGGFSFFINLMLLAPILYMLQVFDRVLTSRSEPTLYMLTVIAVIALVAMAFVDLARSRLMTALGRRIDEMLGERVLKNLILHASSVSRGGYVHGLKDIATLRSFFTGNNIIALFDAPWLIFFILVIFLFHPVMGVIAVLGSAILLLMAWVNEKTNRADIERYQDATRRSGAFMDQGVRNADVLNSMGMTSRFSARWKKSNDETLDRMLGANTRMSAVLSASKFIRQSIQVTMMGVGVYLVIHDNLSPGIMIAATILLGRAMAPVESLIGNWNGLVAARSSYGRLAEMFPEIFADGARQPLPAPSGRIQLERVYLAGKSADNPIIRHVDLDLPAGKSLGILGPSGSGKSSLAKLIVGVWTPTSGHVRIDGADIAHWDRDFLGKHIGYLPQDVELFQGTISDNIGRFDDSDPEAILSAARAAHAYELALHLPDGFDTELGSGGIQLSAGQAQRIGLARALYRKPRIVVLDEPNANLDAEGEQALVQTLVELKNRQTTVIMITHKPALVAPMDYLLVLREGRVELLGPRDEVLSRLGVQPMPHPVPADKAGASS
ncbi:MAG: type I secretion system permease/ATPase [Pseudomonadota bacterium]